MHVQHHFYYYPYLDLPKCKMTNLEYTGEDLAVRNCSR